MSEAGHLPTSVGSQSRKKVAYPRSEFSKNLLIGQSLTAVVIFPRARAGHAPKFSTVRCARKREKVRRCDSTTERRDKRKRSRLNSR